MDKGYEGRGGISPPAHPPMSLLGKRGSNISRDSGYGSLRTSLNDSVRGERRTGSWLEEGKGNLRQEREEPEMFRRYPESLDGESIDEPTERNPLVTNFSFYDSVCTIEGRQDKQPTAERATTMKREAIHIEQPPDDIIDITFDRLMLRKGWYELEDYAQDEMKAYSTWRKWDIICRDRAEGAKRRSGHGNSRAVRFARVPEFIESRGMFSGRGSPHPSREMSVDDPERLRYVCTHCYSSYDDTKFSNFLARMKIC